MIDAARARRPARRRGKGGTAPLPAKRRLRPPTKQKAPARTALQKHVDFFDTDGDGKISLADTYHGLRRLGFGVARSTLFSGVINTALGTSTSGAPSLSVDASNIQAGEHPSHTGVYDRNGRFLQQRFDRLFAQHDLDGDGALSRDELTKMIASNRRDIVGHAGSSAEFKLLMYIAGEMRDGRKVLTRERLQRFYDGTLFYELAKEVAATRKKPEGAVTRGLRELY